MFELGVYPSEARESGGGPPKSLEFNRLDLSRGRKEITMISKKIALFLTPRPAAVVREVQDDDGNLRVVVLRAA